jgi:DNA-binding SARP family transcriptional activator
MEFRILGPLEVTHEGRPVPLAGAKQRALLAMLLLHANHVVASERLLDELWGDRLPGSGLGALQVRISHLRKALGPGGGLVETSAPGYVLRLDRDQLDLHRFERLVDEAERAEPSLARDKLREALGLWRGPALADFAYEAFAQTPINRLEEMRLLALERRIDADLALGRHAELVGELETLIAEHPLRERLRAQLMLALYRSGRQAEALRAYQVARRVLVDELGIEPGPALQELEKAILRQDPALELELAAGVRRSILVAWLGDRVLEPLLALAEPLARRPPRELIVARLLDDRAGLPAAAAALKEESDTLGARGIVARGAVFTTSAPGADASRLAAEQDVDLVLVGAPPDLLDDDELSDLLRSAPCDVAVLVGAQTPAGPVLVPFAGAEHDWGAIELGAWLAAGWDAPLRLAGPAVEGGRDASRLLASASLAVQRALGVTAEPLLIEPGPEALTAAARNAAVAIIGLSDRWRREGLGPARSALVRSGRPILLVRKGPPPRRSRACREPHSLHVVAQDGLIIAPMAGVFASCKPESSALAADRTARSTRRMSAQRSGRFAAS